jgi:septum formation protein
VTLILGSGSASRRDMLTAAGIAFEVIPADVDEDAIKQALFAQDADAKELASTLAKEKALAISRLHPGRWVLGGDSVVSVNGQSFDKPKSRDNAREHLRLFSGQVMTLDSAATLAKDGVVVDAIADQARLTVRNLSDDFIEDYLNHEWPAIAACVGCFRIEARGVQLFDQIEGNHFTILGMPLLVVLAMMRAQGIMTS